MGNIHLVHSSEGMFENCNSLEVLDLSNIHLTSWGSKMFKGCTSLKTLYVNAVGNGFASGNEEIFYNCNSLVGGQGTKIGYNLYGYDENGNPLYYYCPDDYRAAHIDGGKDNPGLFTAK